MKGRITVVPGGVGVIVVTTIIVMILTIVVVGTLIIVIVSIIVVVLVMIIPMLIIIPTLTVIVTIIVTTVFATTLLVWCGGIIASIVPLQGMSSLGSIIITVAAPSTQKALGGVN